MNITEGELRRMGFRVHGNTAVKVQKRAASEAKTVKAFLTMSIRSEANANGKLRDSLRRKAEQKAAVVEALGEQIVGRGIPRSVTFILLTQLPQDSDNLARTFKAIRDQIAELAKFNDAADVWRYEQRKPFWYEPRGCWVCIKFKEQPCPPT